jgi:hypothetical protein
MSAARASHDYGLERMAPALLVAEVGKRVDGVVDPLLDEPSL